jgi:pimeloyl-ACP methyl ester carboxylesterase
MRDRFGGCARLRARQSWGLVDRIDLGVDDNELHCRVHAASAPEALAVGAPAAPGAGRSGETLIYLPGLHGDWTLLGPFRHALRERCRLVEFTYPRRTDLALDDYAGLILAELHRHGISEGWIIGESFSSQVAWAIARRCMETKAGPGREGAGHGAGFFRLRGVILAGGFVRHPVPWGVRAAWSVSERIPLWLLGRLCGAYGRLARRRCDRAGAGGAAREIELFVARRSHVVDRAAITSRYRLIRDEDMRPVARMTRCPVYSLTGAADPIVPWPAVSRWLQRWCPGFHGQRIVWRAGHNVLLDAPAESAEQILAWMREKSVVG